MNNYRRDLPAWGISLLINGVMLTAFHFIAWTVTSEQQNVEIISVMDDVIDQESIFIDSVVADAVGTDGETLMMAPALAAASVPQAQQAVQEKIEEAVNPEIPTLVEGDISLPEDTDFTATFADNKGTTDSISGGAAGVMDRMTFEIRQSVKERQTLVIWVFDASGSMKERRNAIAKRFEKVYEQLAQEKATDGLYTAVMTFGEKVNVLTPEPVQDTKPLVAMVEGIADDTSGKEMVFSAVGTAVEKWRTFRKNDGTWNKMVFIITDERGDDFDQHLESVIASCKRAKARVFTVGNAAIFGQKQGFVRWVYEDGEEDYIPVDQGPETAFPEGLQLPTWGDTSDWRLNLMSASYGPYALTRLCAETGGMYIVADDQGRGQKFSKEIMRNYSPDYRPMKQAEEDIRKNAAKAALVSTADLTYNEKSGIRNLPVPVMVFAAYNDNILRQEIVEAQKPVAAVDYDIKRLLQSLEATEKDREKIKEPRWRAAYDLAMGRLLALRARYFGYNNMLAAMRSSPKAFEKKENNEWRLVPSDKVDSVDVRKISEKAKKYLQRVVDEHTGTPWAFMAEKELRLDMGWTWQESARPVPPGMEGNNLADEDVARLLLAEEEEQQRRRQMGPPAKPRDRPKL